MHCPFTPVSRRRIISDILVLVTIGLLAIHASPIALAGWDAWEGKALKIGPIKCNHHGEPRQLSGADRAMLQDLVDQLKKPLNPNPDMRYAMDSGLGLTCDQAWARVNCMRANLKAALELAIGMLPDAECRKWLRRQAEAGHICVGWGLKVGGSVKIDRAADEANCMPKKRASELIIINIDMLLTDVKFTMHDSNALIVAEVLRHETVHAGQLYKPAPGTLPKNPTDAQRRAALGKVYAQNEVAAHGGGETWQAALAMILCDPDSYDPTKPFPQGIDDATKDVLRSLRRIPNPGDRAAAAMRLKRHMNHYSNWNKTAKECYMRAVEAFCQFLMDGDRDALKRTLANIKWTTYIRWLDHEAFVSTVPPSRITQGSLNPDFDLDGPIIETDIEVLDILVFRGPPLDHLLVIGRNSDGLGELQMYLDINGDGLFEPETKTILFTNSPQLQSNMQLIHNINTNATLVFDAEQLLFFRLIDSNGNGVPNQLLPIPVNLPDPRMDDYLTFVFDPTVEFPALIGFAVVDSMSPAVADNEPLLVLADMDNDGFFEAVVEAEHDQFMLPFPAIEPSTVDVGSKVVEVYARALHPFELWVTDEEGELLELLGLGIGHGVSQEESVFLPRPLQQGEIVIAIDLKSGERTFGQDVGIRRDGESQLKILSTLSTIFQ